MSTFTRTCIHRGIAIFLVTPAALGLRAASAAEREPIQLVYDAPVGCPTEAELVAQVAELGGTFQADPGIENARRFVVQIVGRGPFQGTLRVRDALGEETRRSVSAGTCKQVARPLSVFIALALDDLPALAPPVPSDGAPELPAASPEPAASIARPSNRRGAIAVDSFASIGLSGGNNNAGPQGAYGVHVAMAGHVGKAVYVGGALAASNDPSISGFEGRVGVLLGVGAPWTRGVAGFAVEAGLHLGHGVGVSDDGNYLLHVTSEAPYGAASLLLQVPLRGSLRPYGGHTLLVSTDAAGKPQAVATVNLGLAWQAW